MKKFCKWAFIAGMWLMAHHRERTWKSKYTFGGKFAWETTSLYEEQ